MKKKRTSTGVLLDKALIEELDEIAGDKGISRGEVIRICISEHLNSRKTGVRPDTKRLVMQLEYLQAVMALWINKYHPEHEDSIIDMAQQRVEQFHAK